MEQYKVYLQLFGDHPPPLSSLCHNFAKCIVFGGFFYFFSLFSVSVLKDPLSLFAILLFYTQYFLVSYQNKRKKKKKKKAQKKTFPNTSHQPIYHCMVLKKNLRSHQNKNKK